MKLILVFSFFFGVLSTSLIAQTALAISNQPITYEYNTTPITCNGGMSKQTIKINGGVPPYKVVNQGGGVLVVGAKSGVTYSCGNTNATSYTLTITDAVGTTKVFQAKITQPGPIVEKFTFTPITKKGGMSKQTITITGGTPPYKVVNQGGGALVVGAKSGVSYSGDTYAAKYTYTITDANGCTKSFSVNIPDGK